jgi:hypothetical protein
LPSLTLVAVEEPEQLRAVLPTEDRRSSPAALRWVRTVRTECLDRLLIGRRHHLQRVLTAYLVHYNTGRPSPGSALVLRDVA